jgi:hypothetical protein
MRIVDSATAPRAVTRTQAASPVPLPASPRLAPPSVPGAAPAPAPGHAPGAGPAPARKPYQVPGFTLPTRYIREIGTIAKLRIYWDRVKVADDGRLVDQDECPNSYGGGRPGSHNAYAPLGIHKGEDVKAHSFGKPEDYAPEKWPTACDHCGAAVPEMAWKNVYSTDASEAGEEGYAGYYQVFESRAYDTPSGEPEPGDIFYRDQHWRADGSCGTWDNCPGAHLVVIVPDGGHWDIDSRANNCTMPEDRVHRCWVRRGSPEDGTIDVTKGSPGESCAAGAGSIQHGDYHGHLRHGKLVT